jgi:hypothetical protein
MSRQTEEYEFARKQLKREVKNPSGYTKNRQRAMLDRVYKLGGDKAVREIVKEFWRK